MTPILHQVLIMPLLLPNWLDPRYIIESLGNTSLWAVCAILFVECAIFPVLPGDSLLFAVGMFIAATHPVIHFGGMNKWLVYVIACSLMTLFAVAGNIAGYYVGRFLSPWLFKPRSGPIGTIFSQKNLDASHAFFEKYGSKALVLGRFVPLVRTFVTMVAGASRMNFRHFITWTAIGGVLWVWGVTLLGFLLGGMPFIGNNIDAVLVAIVIVSVIPMVVEYLLEKRKVKREAAVETPGASPSDLPRRPVD